MKTLLPWLLLAAVSFGADISGKWFAKVPARDGTADTTFVFKAEGNKLTGTVSGLAGELPITEGKVEGDSISFVIQAGNRGNQTYKGTITGEEIKMSRTGRNGMPRDFVAKRVK